MKQTIIELSNLKKEYIKGESIVKAVDRINIIINKAKEQRKVEEISEYSNPNKKYVALKPLKHEEGWESQGRSYDIRGLADLVKTSSNIEFIIPDKIQQEIKDYYSLLEKKKKEFLKEKK